MPGVAVVSDTTHYLPRDIVDAEGIRLVSLYVNWPGIQERETRSTACTRPPRATTASWSSR